MFTFQPSLFQTALFFPSLLRKHPKGDVRLPKRKRCQTKPAASYGSSQACQKNRPVRCRVSVYRRERAEDIFFFSSHTLYSTQGSVSGNCYISSETSVDVTSHWPLKCISCYVLCFVWLLQGETADRFQARHKKRALVYSKSMIHETKNAYSYGQQIGGVYHEKNCEHLHSF